jgi:hypothetical protein
MARRRFVDAQQALSFMTTQASYIEAAVYRTVYPDILYPTLVPVDETALNGQNQSRSSRSIRSARRIGSIISQLT